ncbi:hypothetical protein [Jannaschia marina]|uniref:hypothetical protein n=1 Tax=Jannaschia marina TaxID=2741674 RepID=UPI0015C6FC2B|nr:hypothetical protein [Jannaschia marina]
MIPALVLACVGLALAIWVFGRRPRANPCAWSDTGYRNGRMHEFRCETCGITGFGRDGQVPRVCKRGLGR